MKISEKSSVESSLEKRKNKVKEEISESQPITPEALDNLEKLDDTNADVLKAKLRHNIKNNELLIKSYDTLTKTELKEFNIKKDLSNKESYFYFLQYMRNVQIIDGEENNISENIEEPEENEVEIIIDFSKGNMKFEEIKNEKDNITINHFDKNTKEIGDENYKNFVKKKNVNIKEYFIEEEKITLSNLRKKLSEYQEILTYLDAKRNSFPDFQNELFYHNQLNNVILSFLELEDDYEFLQKKQMISFLEEITQNIENNKIKDSNILMYFYLAIDVENELDQAFGYKLKLYDETILEFKNTKYIKEKNQLIISKDNNKNTEIVIENYDLYELDQRDIQWIIDGKIRLPLPECMYSAKGHLLLRDFTKNDGNIIYEKFLPSNLLKDIIRYLYKIEGNIFGLESVIKTFENNTYYFPIKNFKLSAYTDKSNFKIFIDYKMKEELETRNIDKKIKKFIKKAIMTVNIEHEFGHSHGAFLFFYDSKNDVYDSPKAKIILNENEEITTNEGGYLFEYILYGRKIEGLNLKEAIYINNHDNFSKNLKQFRDDFINLDNEPLIAVFEREGKNNSEIQEIYKTFKNLPKEKQQYLESKRFKLGKINKNSFIEFENYIFYQNAIRKPHDKHKKYSRKKLKD